VARLFDRSGLLDGSPDVVGHDDARPAARALSAALSALLVSFLIVARSHDGLEVRGRSYANGQPSVAAPEVSVTDDDGGVPMFDVPALEPGSTVVQCIDVRYDGSADDVDIRLLARSYGTLASRMQVTVDVGPLAAFGDCSGFVADATVYDGTLEGLSTLADGVMAFAAAAPGDHQAFRFTTRLNGAEPVSGSATADFTWTATIS